MVGIRDIPEAKTSSGRGVTKPTDRKEAPARLSEKQFPRRVVSTGWLGWALLMTHLGMAGETSAKDLDPGAKQHLAGLRDRGLYRLAESYCEHRLSQLKNSPQEQTDLTLELTQTLIEHARTEPLNDRIGLRLRAREILSTRLTEDHAVAGRRQLQARLAQVLVETGGDCRFWLEVAPWDATVRRCGIDALKSAGDLCQQVEAEVGDRNPTSRQPGKDRPSPTAERRQLERQIRFLHGRSRVDLAELHPVDSVERAGYLNEAVRGVKPLAQGAIDDALVWDCRLLLIRSARLAGDFKAARRQIAALIRQETPPPVCILLQLEEARCRLAEGDIAGTQETLDACEAETDPSWLETRGELRVLRALTLAAGCVTGQSSSTPETNPNFQRTIDFITQASQEVAGAWSERLDAVARGLREELELGRELGRLALSAEAAWRGHELAEAARLFATAHEAASEQGRDEPAFRFGMQAGSIDLELQDWKSAAERLLNLAQTYPNHPRMTEAHLLGVYSLGRQWRSSRTSQAQAEYRAELHSHLERFPESATRFEAEWMYAELLTFEKDYRAALEHYLLIPKHHPRGPGSRVAAGREYERLLAATRGDDARRDALAHAAERELTDFLEPIDGPLSGPRQSVAVSLAAVLRYRHPPRFAAADGWLARVLQSTEADAPTVADQSPTDPPRDAAQFDSRERGRRLRIVTLAGMGRLSEARQQLEGLSPTKPADLLAVVEDLAPLVAANPGEPAFEGVADLLVRAARLVEARREELGTAQSRRLDLALARGLRANSQPDRAQHVYERLQAESPRDPLILSEHGELLIASGSPTLQQTGLGMLRECETLHREGTVDWLEARLRLAEALVRTQAADAAWRLVRKTRVFYPDLGNERLRRAYLELEHRTMPPAIQPRHSGPRSKT